MKAGCLIVLIVSRINLKHCTWCLIKLYIHLPTHERPTFFLESQIRVNGRPVKTKMAYPGQLLLCGYLLTNDTYLNISTLMLMQTRVGPRNPLVTGVLILTQRGTALVRVSFCAHSFTEGLEP